MIDSVSKATRSRIMSRIKSKNTSPEMTVRKMLFALGYRYRLHSKKLPGTPDIVLSRHNAVIFVHGCFWHHHRGCKRGKAPSTRVNFWQNKLAKNVERDRQCVSALRRLNWRVLVIWECKIKDTERLQATLAAFLNK